MKKRLMAVLAATAVLGCTTAFAVNPFSDVTPNDWAYQAVSQLAAEGIINGYPDGTFKGQRNITRYEMAQMVAKAMVRQNRVDAEQQAMIQRLANEFSAELNNLGVRVGNLEKKVGNVRIGGEATLKYEHNDSVDADKSATGDKVDEASAWKVGAKLKLSAAPSKNVEFGATIKTEDLQLDKESDSHLYLDELWVGTNVKGLALKAGRMGVTWGSGLVFDDNIDGVFADFDAANMAFSVGHGSFSNSDKEVTYGQLSGKVADKFKLTGYYAKIHGEYILSVVTDDEIVTSFKDVYGVALETNVKNVKLMGEWATSNAKTTTGVNAAKKEENAKNRNAWVVGAGFGNYDISKAGTADIMVQYFNEGVNSPVLSTTFDQEYARDFKGWVLTGNYAVADNLGLTLVYGFAGERTADLPKATKTTDYPAHYYAKLKYVF